MSPSSKTQGVLNLKKLMLTPFCIQTANLEMDAKTLYLYSLLKKEITQTGYSTKEIF